MMKDLEEARITIGRMQRALEKIRERCMVETGKQVNGIFVRNSFAEEIGNLAGVGMTGMMGGDREYRWGKDGRMLVTHGPDGEIEIEPAPKIDRRRRENRT